MNNMALLVAMKAVWEKMDPSSRQKKLKKLGIERSEVTRHVPIELVSGQNDFGLLPYELRFFLRYCFDGNNFTRLNLGLIRSLQQKVKIPHDFSGIDHYCLGAHD